MIHPSALPPISGQAVVSLTQQSRDCCNALNKVVLVPAEVVPDSQPPTLPEFYTSPIPVCENDAVITLFFLNFPYLLQDLLS